MFRSICVTWSSNSGTRSVPYKLQQATFKRDRYTCRCGYIGRPHAGDLHADHIINRAEGGQDELDNLETLCIPCHGIKTAAERTRGWNRRQGRRRPRPHPSDALSEP